MGAGAEHAAGPAVHVPAGAAEGTAGRLAGASPDVGEQAAAVVSVAEPTDVQQRHQASRGALVPAGTRAFQGRHAGQYPYRYHYSSNADFFIDDCVY